VATISAVLSRKEVWEDVSLVLRYTRKWLHYGLFGHIVICTVIAALEGLLGR